MKKGLIILFLFLLFLVLTLNIYWFASPSQIQFDQPFFNNSVNSEFSISNSSNPVLFYDNMRFPYRNISYSIDENCSIQKKSNMKEAFDIIQNITVLRFYPNKTGEILVSCQDKTVVDNGMFIAGEGGPTKIIQSGKYNLILGGQILLIRDPSCSKPQVAVHELLHVLGFNHSENKRNIMYPYSKCTQTIGEEIPTTINELYSDPSLPDLAFENINATIKSGLLDFNLTVRNIGITDAGNSTLKVYINDKVIKEYALDSLQAGTGLKLTSTNIFAKRLNINKIAFEISNNFQELDKGNNKKELIATQN